MKIEIHEIKENPPETRWCWIILKWADQVGWFNKDCGHKPTFNKAAQAAFRKYIVQPDR